ncbi:AraC family transcriptional regulator [Romeriopsis navalis]|uniref:AraC family transcriptional regulator n=1 Tax=Romeriopsis navalis TaxID=2992132 RepID=UPI0029C9FC61|nr:AraC family transcriptional regulator [Romeriopsis navalis]
MEQFQPSPGEARCQFEGEHTIFLSLAPRPVELLQVHEGKTYTSLSGKGDIALLPADMPLFARWDSPDHYLRIRLSTQFMQNVAQETLSQNPDHLEFTPTANLRHPQIESIGMMLLGELQQSNIGNRLYVDALANALAVNLLRHYVAHQSAVPTYTGGVPQWQLRLVIDYIDASLAQDIKLADLAQLLDMSQFHFGRLFKQSIGVSPHQYLIQQRVEWAKQLLKQTDRLIVDIALDCGFNSHSHLTKQFCQLTGLTPKAYRTS